VVILNDQHRRLKMNFLILKGHDLVILNGQHWPTFAASKKFTIGSGIDCVGHEANQT